MKYSNKFVEFILRRGIRNKYNVDELFKYDYNKDESTNELELSQYKDNFYIDGSDLKAAFEAGIKVAKSWESDDEKK